MTRPLKTPEQLAKEHWDWIEGVILTEMRLTMKLFVDGFVHGYKHGKEDTIEHYNKGTRGKAKDIIT